MKWGGGHLGISLAGSKYQALKYAHGHLLGLLPLILLDAADQNHELNVFLLSQVVFHQPPKRPLLSETGVLSWQTSDQHGATLLGWHRNLAPSCTIYAVFYKHWRAFLLSNGLLKPSVISVQSSKYFQEQEILNSKSLEQLKMT